MVGGRSWSTLVAVVGALALGVGVAACGSAKKAGTPTIGGHTRTHADNPASTAGSDTTTVGSTTSTSTAAGTTTTGGSPTTPASGGGSTSGSGGSSGGASLSDGTTSTTTTTTTSTSTACKGQDCQSGSPTVPGSVAPVNGKCSSGYVYVAAQDGGPALCVPAATPTTSATATQ